MMILVYFVLNLVLNKICMFSLLVLDLKYDQINGPIDPYLRSIIVSLLSIKSSVRMHSKTNVLKAVSLPGGSKLAAALLNATTQFLESNVYNNLYFITQ